ncbi:MAG: type IV pilin N-terminal domain-containing protein [Thermoplasmatota archaeon]|jgi:FlaG/FlaF family flagellin (archaellin)
MIKKIYSKLAVSEVIGVVLLLGMTIILYALLNSNVSTFSFSTSAPFVNLVATIDESSNMVYIEHNGGESLELTTDITIVIGSDSYTKKAGDLLVDLDYNCKWSFGETLKFSLEGINIQQKYIQVTVVESNTVLLSVVLQKGMS